MKWKDIRWGAAFGGFLLAEVALFASAFAWVAIYSYLIHPGETPEFYQRYAQVASPWVSLVVGTPLFYFLCRWIGSQVPARALATAMTVFGLCVLADLALVSSMGAPSPRILGFMAASHLLKFLASYLGALSATRKEVVVRA